MRGVFAPPSGNCLMGEMIEHWGDDGIGSEDYPPEFGGPLEAIEAAEKDLDDLLKAWFERHRAIMPTPWCFADSRNTETFTRFGWEPYLHNPKLKHRLHRIRIPTLFLWGTHDRILSGWPTCSTLCGKGTR